MLPQTPLIPCYSQRTLFASIFCILSNTPFLYLPNGLLLFTLQSIFIPNPKRSALTWQPLLPYFALLSFPILFPSCPKWSTVICHSTVLPSFSPIFIPQIVCSQYLPILPHFVTLLPNKYYFTYQRSAVMFAKFCLVFRYFPHSPFSQIYPQTFPPYFIPTTFFHSSPNDRLIYVQVYLHPPISQIFVPPWSAFIYVSSLPHFRLIFPFSSVRSCSRRASVC